MWPVSATGLSGDATGDAIGDAIGDIETGSTSELVDQPFAASAMGDSMDSDLLPKLSGETWVAATNLDEVTSDLPPFGLEPPVIGVQSELRSP